MAIDLNREHVLTLAQAASTLPRRRAGKKPHLSTLYRWSSRGLRGIRLETIQVGGTACTSREALQRFFDQLTQPGTNMPRQQPARSRARHIREAEEKLRAERF